MSKRFRDASGAQLRVGDTVRVIGVPDLSGMSADCRAESQPVFKYLVGKYKRIVEFDEFGQAWLSFRIRKARHSEHHSVGIEPHLLRLRQFRKPPNTNA